MPQETYSFVVRVWKEGAGTGGHTTSWRGSVDNVLTGGRSYIRDLDSISHVIRSQLSLVRREALDEEQSEVDAESA